MERKVNKLEHSHVEVLVTVDEKSWKDAQQKAFNKEAQKISIPGFRAGKAPISMVKSKIDQAKVYDEAVNSLLPRIYKEILEEEKLEPFAQPKVDVTKLSETELEVKFTVVTAPEVKLGQYKGLSVGKTTPEITDKEVEDAVKESLKQNATLVVKEDTAKEGDTVVIDFVGTIDGEKFDGGSAENHELELGSHSFIPGFEEQLVGVKAGEHVDVKVKFPENYVENLKGKDAVFGVDVHEVKEKKLPELTDDFVKELAIPGVEDVASFQQHRRSDLLKQKEQQAKNEFLSKALKQIAENSEFDIPDEVVEGQAESHKKDAIKSIQQHGLTLETYLQTLGQSEEDFNESLKKQSLQEIKDFLILNEIGRTEELQLSDEDVEFEIAKLADQYKMTVDQVKKALEKSMDQFVNNITMSRIEDFIFREND